MANQVRAWFFNVQQNRYSGIAIAGSNGTGKSHVARAAQRAFGAGAIFWSEPTLISRIWAAYSGEGASEVHILGQCRNARLFILDDLGQAHVTSIGWLDQIYWQLFDAHPLDGRGAVMITTNLPWIRGDSLPFLERVGASAADRIIGLLGGLDPATGRPARWIELTGIRSWRERHDTP